MGVSRKARFLVWCWKFERVTAGPLGFSGVFKIEWLSEDAAWNRQSRSVSLRTSGEDSVRRDWLEELGKSKRDDSSFAD